jgi:antitoxin MazE
MRLLPFDLQTIRNYNGITMKLNIVPIGNSQGIRIPKPLLQQAGIKDAVEIEVKGNLIIIRPAKKRAREGWAEAFMVPEKEEKWLEDLRAIPNNFDGEEWEW